MDGGRAGFPACQGCRPSTNRGTNKRMETADRGRQTAGWTMVGQAFQPVRVVDRQRMGERINEWRPQTADGRQQTADRRRTGLQPGGGQAVNEWGSTDRGPQTAGGRQTLVGRAFQPVRDCQQMGERINESDRRMDNRKHRGAAGRHRHRMDSHSQRGFTDCDPSSERPGSRGGSL